MKKQPWKTEDSKVAGENCGTCEYWGCTDFTCRECPAAIDGKDPAERYGCRQACGAAMRLDLIARAKRLAGVSDEL